jgi:hypothetical protein
VHASAGFIEHENGELHNNETDQQSGQRRVEHRPIRIEQIQRRSTNLSHPRDRPLGKPSATTRSNTTCHDLPRPATTLLRQPGSGHRSTCGRGGSQHPSPCANHSPDRQRPLTLLGPDGRLGTAPTGLPGRWSQYVPPRSEHRRKAQPHS